MFTLIWIYQTRTPYLLYTLWALLPFPHYRYLPYTWPLTSTAHAALLRFLLSCVGLKHFDIIGQTIHVFSGRLGWTVLTFFISVFWVH